MSKKSKHVKSTKGIEVLKNLSVQKNRIITNHIFSEEAIKIGVSKRYVNELIHHLQKDDWLYMIKPGLYVMNDVFLSGIPIHEYEILNSALGICSITHFSAMVEHELTDQIPHKIFASVPEYIQIPKVRKRKGSTIDLYGFTYTISVFQEDKYFGYEKKWFGETRIFISDLERTLLDGLLKPQYCGGLSEVCYAFEIAKSRISVEKIINYAKQTSQTACKRLGWVLSKIGIQDNDLSELKDYISSNYVKLDVSSKNKGNYNAKWRIEENLT